MEEITLHSAQEIVDEYNKKFNRDDLKIEHLQDGWERISFVEDGYCHSIFRKINVGYCCGNINKI